MLGEIFRFGYTKVLVIWSRVFRGEVGGYRLLVMG